MTQDEAPVMPRRGDAVESWIRDMRDSVDRDTSIGKIAFDAIDRLLRDYHHRADTGAPLSTQRPDES
jgi:hypothetical protein